MKLSVVIPYWKRPKELTLILESLNAQAEKIDLLIEILVCDSHSDNEVYDVIKASDIKHSYLNINHLHTKNILAAKRNIGIKYSTGDYIIFLDDDCIPNDNFLKICLNYCDKLNARVVYCGEVRFLREQTQISNYYKYRDCQHPNMENRAEYHLNAWTFVAMNFIISKKNIDKFDLRFNENFAGYGFEDHDFGLKLIANDFRIIQGHHKIWHYELGGDISKYLVKIHRSARDGLKVLRQTQKESIQNNKKIALIENIFLSDNPLLKFVNSLAFNKFLVKNVNKFVVLTDRKPKLYSRLLYRYLILNAFKEGVQEGKNSDNLIDLEKSWYN